MAAFFKKHFNYPILFLSIIALFNIKRFLSEFILLFKVLFTYPVFLLGSLRSFLFVAFPYALIVLLWLDRVKKIKARTPIAIACAVFTALSLWDFISTFLSTIKFMELNLLSVYPKVLSILSIAFYGTLSYVLFKKPEKRTAFTVLAVVLSLATFILHGSSAIAIGGSITGIITSILQIVGLWYIPKALDGSGSADITDQNFKILLSVCGIAVFILLVSSMCSSPSRSSYSSGGSYSSSGGFIGSDGEYHPYIPEFGDDVNSWMEENW